MSATTCPEPISEQPLLTGDQLARRWSVTKGWLAHLRCAGTGPRFIKIGAAVRYRLPDVESYELAQTIDTAA